MFVRRFMGISLILLLGLGFLMAGSAVGYRIGWTQGVIAQHTLSNGLNNVAMLALPLQFGYPGGMFGAGPVGGGFGMLLFLLLLVLLVGLALRAFAAHTWRTADGTHFTFGSDTWTWRCARKAHAGNRERNQQPKQTAGAEGGERDASADDIS